MGLTPRTSDAPPPRLSDVDIRVLQMMAAGQSMAKIARHLQVSERTLYRTARRLTHALRAETRSEALVKASQWGLLSTDKLEVGGG